MKRDKRFIGTFYKNKRDRRFSGGKLISWIQRRCIVCGRFLGLYQMKFCIKHLKESRAKSKRESNYRKYHSDSGFREYKVTRQWARRRGLL